MRRPGAIPPRPPRRLPWAWLLASGLAAAACRSAATTPPVEGPYEFVVETASRGRGVPEPALEAWLRVQALLRPHAKAGEVALSESLIGLEGERRLQCIFADGAAGREAYRAVRKIVEGVDLIICYPVPRSAEPPSGPGP